MLAPAVELSGLSWLCLLGDDNNRGGGGGASFRIFYVLSRGGRTEPLSNCRKVCNSLDEYPVFDIRDHR